MVSYDLSKVLKGLLKGLYGGLLPFEGVEGTVW
jgi:hypothetical protein